MNTPNDKQTEHKPPRAFVSYSWDNAEHCDWVRDLSTRLRRDGIDVTLDQWHLIPGDQLPEFMERSVRENDYVLIICTPNYKKKSDNRLGGVGSEGDIMTAEVFTTGNHRKFIPILRIGEWKKSAPSWLAGTIYIDLSGNSYSETHYQDLKNTLRGERPQVPPIGQISEQKIQKRAMPESELSAEPENTSESIKILGIVVDEITKPLNDGTRGSGLYAIPFRLSEHPSSQRATLFVETWNHPPQFTTMHRSGIARVAGDKVVLDGTTIDEVEKYHRDTLKLVIERTNQLFQEFEQKSRQNLADETRREAEYEVEIREKANRIKFD